MGALDPLGLSPMSADELHAYTEAHKSPLEKAAGAVGNWWKDNWEYVAAGVAIFGGFALMCSGVGGIAGVALMAGAGGLMSGGVSVASQKASNGSVDWKNAGKDALIGTATGAVGGAGMAVAKGATEGMTSGGTQLAKAMGINAGVNGVAGGAGSTVQYLATHGGRIENGRDFAGNVVGGTVASAAGANLGPASGTLAKKIGPTIKGSSVFKAAPNNITKNINFNANGNVSTSIKTLGTMGVGAGGSVLSEADAGRDLSGKNALTSAATSGVSAKVGDKVSKNPTVGYYTNQRGVNTLKQMQSIAPKSMNGLTNVSQTNTRTMYGSAVSGTIIGTSIGYGTDKIQDGLGL
ncbi:hypothetical protein D8M21_11180 [Kocuria sp. HSID16901]|nr:hypothetical protein D8M21_11180 [Kocuria sp. HSID16901]